MAHPKQPDPQTRPQPDPLGRVTLVTGAEEFLNERAVSAAVAAVRVSAPEAEVGEVTADRLSPATFADLVGPSLFSSARCVVVRSLQDLPDDTARDVIGYADDPGDDVALILVHSGGAKGKGVLDRLRKAAAVVEVRSQTPKPSEFARFVASEVGASGGQISRDAADALVESIGPDLRALAGAARQLVADSTEPAGSPLTAEFVRRYFAGRAEVKSFAVADAAISGRTAEALGELRWALESGTAPVLVTSAFASGLRGIARVRSAAPGVREAELAREAGVPPWKVRTLRDQARGWSDEGIVTAITAVATADAEVKGAAGDATYALERMVMTVAGARGPR